MLYTPRSRNIILLLWLITVLTLPLSAIAGSAIPCDIQHGPCVMEMNGMTITFDILPKPVRTLSELQFMVIIKRNNTPVTDASVTLNLSMPGMYMGKNRPVLRHFGRGTYQGTGIITRCTTGKKTWQAKITVGRGDPATIARYQFEVL
jgi:hypothetical protein